MGPEDDQHQAEPQEDSQPNQQGSARHTRRHIATILCGVMSVLLMILGVSGIWVMRTATDQGWVEEQVAAVLRNPEVSDQLAVTLVNEVDAAVDLDAKVEEILPKNFSGAVPVIVSAARSQMEQQVSRALRSDRVVHTAAAVVGKAQSGAVAVLTNDAEVPGVDLATGEVRINLLPLVPQVIEAAHKVGVLKRIEAPDLAGLDRSEQLAAVSDAIGKPLAEDFANPVVFRSDAVSKAGNTLDTVRTILLWTRRLFWLFIIAGIGLGAAALYLSRSRSRAALWLGAGAVAAFFVTRMVVARALSQLPSIPKNLGGQAALRGITDSAADQLTGWYAWFGIGMVVILGAVWYFTRPTHRVRPSSE